MELIDRDALKAKLLKNVEELADKTGFFEGIKLGYQSAVHFVEQAPTVEERKHGRWLGGGAYYCSNCNAYAATDTHRDFLDVRRISIIAITAGLLWTVTKNETNKLRRTQ